MKKKLIGFDDELIEKIEEYAKEKKITFTDMVRNACFVMVDPDYKYVRKNVGADTPEDEKPILDKVTVDIIKKYMEKTEKLEKDMSWWNADENESKVGNINVKVNDMEKKINVLTNVSKLFKSHLKDRSIHLQD